MVKQRYLSLLALCASFFGFVVIGLGVITRLLDAGLGCPDWPGCYGHLIVPAEQQGQIIIAYKAWAEMIHRYFVGGLSLLIVAIITFIFTQRALRTRRNVIFAIFLILLLCYQIMLGQWTVTLRLLPIVVTQHLLGGFLIFSTVWLIHLSNKNHILNQHMQSADKNLLLILSIGALFILLLQLFLGAWTSTNYASLSCPDFPFCMKDKSVEMQFKEAFQLFSPLGVNYEGGVLPLPVRQTIQIMHRIGALVVTTYMLLLMAIAFLRLHFFPHMMKIIYVMMALLCIQLCMGISNVIFKLSIVTAVIHNLVAALMLLTLLTFIYRLIEQGKKGVVT